jgi:peptidoglycan/xylan/chitin deacetylase (PgdA/CDA1 family)
MIYAMHGVARSRRADSFEHRGLLETELFESYLAAREPFVDLHCALRGGGDALTIDDATMAAADAALSALKYGHQVTLFVNGFNVKYQHPYCFSVVNLLLDHTQVKSVEIEGEHYEVETFEQRRQFRQQIKQAFRHFKDHKQESVFIENLATGLRVEIDRGAEARVLTQDDLLKLTSRGVKLGNHGWTHTDPQQLSVDEFEHQVSNNRHWLQDTLAVDSPFYAVPFGETVPPVVNRENLFEYCFLLRDTSKPLTRSKELVNRTNLVLRF